MDILYVGKTTINYIINLFKRDFCQKTDIIDNCDTDIENKPLSAKQGKALQDQITQIDKSIDVADLDEVKDFLNI